MQIFICLYWILRLLIIAMHTNWRLGMQKGMIALKNSSSKDSQARIIQRTLKQKENRPLLPPPNHH